MILSQRLLVGFGTLAATACVLRVGEHLRNASARSAAARSAAKWEAGSLLWLMAVFAAVSSKAIL